jgi:hypothetical protein
MNSWKKVSLESSILPRLLIKTTSTYQHQAEGKESEDEKIMDGVSDAEDV